MFLKQFLQEREAERRPFQVIPHKVDMFSKNVGEEPIQPKSELAAEDAEDNIEDKSIALKTDTRKTRLTIEQINRLRKLNDVKIAEYQKDVKNIKTQYKAPVEGGDAGGL